MICGDVVSAVGEGRSPLVLTERIEHLQCLAQLLSPDIPNLILLHGGQSKKELTDARARLAELPATAARVLLATGKYIGEGFDDPRLDALFLALPISWRRNIAHHFACHHPLAPRPPGARIAATPHVDFFRL